MSILGKWLGGKSGRKPKSGSPTVSNPKRPGNVSIIHGPGAVTKFVHRTPTKKGTKETTYSYNGDRKS